MVMLGRCMFFNAARRYSVSRHLMVVRTSLSVRGARSTLTVRTLATASNEGYVSRNRRMGRPMSPSLRILVAHPDMVWTLSVAHRTTGCILTAGVTAGAITYLAMGQPFPEFIAPLQSLANHSALWTTGKFLVALPLCYHMVNGIRHLSWDAGRGFEMRTLYKSGYLVLTATVLLAGALALYKPSH